VIIQFKAARHFLPFLITAIVIGASIIVWILKTIHNYPQGVGRGVIAILGIIIGFLIYCCLVMIIKKVIANDYQMEFSDNEIIIESKKNNQRIRYEELVSFTVYNNGEYAKIVINAHAQKQKYYIGFANMKFTPGNHFQILDSFSELDSLFIKKGFVKNVNKKASKKGLNIVEYKKASEKRI